MTQRGAGANLSVDVAAGTAFVAGADVSLQGTYECWNDATVNVPGLTVPGAGTFHHRIVLQVQDKLNNGAWTGYTGNLMALLDTGTGLPAQPNSAITVATVDIPTASASVTNSMINDWRQQVGPIAAVKPADLARTHVTTPADDPDLQLALLAASATYDVEGFLLFKGGTGGDLAFTWRTSGSSGGSYDAMRTSTTSNLSLGNAYVWTDTHTAQTTGTSNSLSMTFRGTYKTGATPPQYLVLQWAQNTDSGTATTVLANSWLRTVRVA